MLKLEKYPPGPSGGWPGSLTLALLRDPIRVLMRQASYGDIVYMRWPGRRQMYFLNNPDYISEVLVNQHRNFVKSGSLQKLKGLVGDGLLTSESDFHHRQRRLVLPAFQHQRIMGYGAVMAEYARRQSSRWQDGDTLDIHQEMMRLTLAIVSKTLFDTDVESEADLVGRAIKSCLEHVFQQSNNPLASVTDKLPLPGTRRNKEAIKTLDAFIYRMIAERRESGKDHGDLLSMLLDAVDAEGNGAKMSGVQARDEAMTIFLAGHETTAVALTWTLFLLSSHPEVEERLHQEIEEVLDDRLPTAEEASKLKYTRIVFAEALRLYPPAPAIGRKVINDFELGGYNIRSGSLVGICPYVMHRNPDYFPEPDLFKPERWSREMKERLPKFAYFPFGGGPRGCIGEGFAWMEGTILLATIAQQWRMKLVPGHRVVLQPRLTLRPKYGMKMILQRRKATEQ